jgi:large conductance mechanosensitive channel
VAVVIGAAFGAVVTAFVTDIITPAITIPGSVNFSSLRFTIGGGTFLYGSFINSLITFILLAAAVFFLVVKPINTLMERRKTQPDVESVTKQCPECLSNIPSGAKRCAFCTSPQ